jgi:hypothetical protein
MHLLLGTLNGFMDNHVSVLLDAAAFGLFLMVFIKHLLKCGELVGTGMECALLLDANTMLELKVVIIIQK